MPDNSITLIGTLGRDPELRFTPTGQATASFSIAVNRRWQNRQTQEWEERVSWFDVIAWRELAENVGESLTKGSRVIVTGRLEQRSWETQEGEKRHRIEVIADEIGPSLRWATAQVVKNERRGPDNSRSGTPQERSAPNSPSGSGASGIPDDEEPFIKMDFGDVPWYI